MDIKDARKRIDEIDREIAELLTERFKMAEEIGKYKGDAGMSIRDRDREASVIANALNFSEPPYDKYVGSVFESIINSAVVLQNDGRK